MQYKSDAKGDVSKKEGDKSHQENVVVSEDEEKVAPPGKEKREQDGYPVTGPECTACEGEKKEAGRGGHFCASIEKVTVGVYGEQEEQQKEYAEQ